MNAQNVCLSWRPIETAPRDGTPIITWNGRGRAFAAYDNGLSAWVYQTIYKEPSREVGLLSDTHWTPLPEPPKP